MRILVLQHARSEHPGFFRHLLEEDGHDWVPAHLDEGDDLPGIEGFDALWVMGGPMDVWEEDAHPWLGPEKALIHEAVEERGLPYLGLCLGHQLLACALGGEVAKGTPEIGVMPVLLTELGAEGIYFDGVESPLMALQWHGAEVTRLPEGARVLATSPACAVQAMSWGTRAFSTQFHVEIEADTVANWCAIPEYAAALDEAMGGNGREKMSAACDTAMRGFNTNAERIYINWLQATASV